MKAHHFVYPHPCTSRHAFYLELCLSYTAPYYKIYIFAKHVTFHLKMSMDVLHQINISSVFYQFFSTCGSILCHVFSCFIFSMTRHLLCKFRSCNHFAVIERVLDNRLKSYALKILFVTLSRNPFPEIDLCSSCCHSLLSFLLFKRLVHRKVDCLSVSELCIWRSSSTRSRINLSFFNRWSCILFGGKMNW